MLESYTDQIGLFTFYLQQLASEKHSSKETQANRQTTISHPESYTDIILQLAQENQNNSINLPTHIPNYNQQTKPQFRKLSKCSQQRYHHRNQISPNMPLTQKKQHQQLQTGYSNSLQLKAHLLDLKTCKQIEPIELIEELKRTQINTIKQRQIASQINQTIKLNEISQNLNQRKTIRYPVRKDSNKELTKLRYTLMDSIPLTESDISGLKVRHRGKHMKLPFIRADLRKAKEKPKERNFKISSYPIKLPAEKWKNPTKCLHQGYLEPIRNHNKNQYHSLNAYQNPHLTLCPSPIIKQEGNNQVSPIKQKKYYLTPKSHGHPTIKKLI